MNKTESIHDPATVTSVAFAGVKYIIADMTRKQISYMMAAGFRGSEYKALLHEYMKRKL